MGAAFLKIGDWNLRRHLQPKPCECKGGRPPAKRGINITSGDLGVRPPSTAARLRACADPERLQDATLEEVIGWPAHERDSSNLGQERCCSQESRERRLGDWVQFGGNRDRNKRPGRVSAADQCYPDCKTPA